MQVKIEILLLYLQSCMYMVGFSNSGLYIELIFRKIMLSLLSTPQVIGQIISVLS